MKEALFWQGEGDAVRCGLCPHGCLIKEGGRGFCLARKNEGGVLYALNYGMVSSLALDPIEKKPLRDFSPGSLILSAGSFGCNFKCAFCQNHEISQQEAVCGEVTPERLVSLAKDLKAEGNIGLAFTYNEPMIWYEFVYDSAKLNKAQGMKNVLVTNGYVSSEPLEELLPFIDAMNIDLKAFTPDFYSRVCRGEIGPVKETIARCARACHVEVTTLVIPGKNDGEEEIAALAEWLAGLSPDIPLHLTRHHPDYRMAEPPPMSREKLYALAALARRSLRRVYCGNC